MSHSPSSFEQPQLAARVFEEPERVLLEHPADFPVLFGKRNFVRRVFHRDSVHHLRDEHAQPAALVFVGRAPCFERRIEVGQNLFVLERPLRIFAYDDFAFEPRYRFFSFEVQPANYVVAAQNCLEHSSRRSEPSGFEFFEGAGERIGAQVFNRVESRPQEARTYRGIVAFCIHASQNITDRARRQIYFGNF